MPAETRECSVTGSILSPHSAVPPAPNLSTEYDPRRDHKPQIDLIRRSLSTQRHKIRFKQNFEPTPCNSPSRHQKNEHSNISPSDQISIAPNLHLFPPSSRTSSDISPDSAGYCLSVGEVFAFSPRHPKPLFGCKRQSRMCGKPAFTTLPA